MNDRRSGLEHGRRLEQLLDALEDVPAAQRAARLASLCPDPELRRDVLALLAAESSSAGYLQRLTGGLVPDRPRPAALAGRRIGAYRLLKLLGHGGMGVVYEAQRADGAFEQRVALKLLATALADTEARKRFLAERRILAGLEHPAIARIVDGGVAGDGTPWFAMEYVAGLPIDVYCDQHQLRIRERLQLFVQVCDAVEHAHRRLVVHRDLKPANVLVTTDRRIKLLDFGIAKLLDTEEAQTGATTPTRATLRLMTPEYASPEQVRGQAVTTASDVYQLGLLLYELLSGHRPYAVHQRRPGELERVICEQPPTRLSAAVTREDTIKPPQSGADTAAGTPVERVCRARRSSPARLKRRLRGDLENIVSKALSKEPERRYGSADRLVQDLRRHLAGLPVTARADTWIYRSRKFLRRHSLAAASVLTVLLLVIVMTAFHTVRVQSERDSAQLERDRAQAERDRAEIEAAKAAQMSQFLVGLLRDVDPRQARGHELTARELLDRGVQRVDRELAAQPDVQAEMLQVLGRTYLELGHHRKAQTLLDRTLSLRRARLHPDHPEIAGVMADRGLLYYRQGAYEQALQQLEQAGGILERAAQPDAAMLAEVLGILGQTYRSLGRHADSQATLERALAIQIQASGEQSAAVAVVLNMLGIVLAEAGAYAEAEALYQQALDILRQELGADHPSVGNTLTNLAMVRGLQGITEGVEALYRQGVAVLEQAYGAHHVRVAAALGNLGHFLTAAGQHDEAIIVLERALHILEAAVEADHPDLTYPLSSLGDAHFARGEFERAQRYYRQSMRIREHALARRRFDPLLMHNLVRLGRIESLVGDERSAAVLMQRALDMWDQAPDIVDPQLAPALFDLGDWLAARGRCTEAAPLLQRAAGLRRREAESDAAPCVQPDAVSHTGALRKARGRSPR